MPTMTPLAVLETALYAHDLRAAEAFYSTVMELELDSKDDDRHLFFKCGGAMLLIFNPAATAEEGGCFRRTEQPAEDMSPSRWTMALSKDGLGNLKSAT
jgi:predicted enzyme related to lactoylglutathione lyase